jgi:cobalt/nickel transport system permease protein
MQARLLTYQRLDSFVHRMDPRWKLAGLLSGMATAACLQRPVAGLTAFVATLVLMAAARLPLRWFASRLLGTSVLLSFVLVLLPFTLPGRELTLGPVALSERGIWLALAILLKALTIVGLTLTLLATTPFDALLKACGSLRMPGILIQLATLTYRHIHLIFDELARLRTALRLRGWRRRMSLRHYRTLGQAAGVLLVRSHERAERVRQAMRCRGFDGTYRSVPAFRSGVTDVAGFAAMGLALAAAPLTVEWRCPSAFLLF